MDAVALTRQLVDIESITGNEAGVGEFLYRELCRLGYPTRKMLVESDRFNVYATPQRTPEAGNLKPGDPPAVVFSTQYGHGPALYSFSEDESRIYGRGSCDAKGIIAAQIAAAERLRQENIYVACSSSGRRARQPGREGGKRAAPGCKYLVNGEPTENRIALASKGTLPSKLPRRTHAPFAYPELGVSAIDKLLTTLERLRRCPCLPIRVGPVHAEHWTDRRRSA